MNAYLQSGWTNKEQALLSLLRDCGFDLANGVLTVTSCQGKKLKTTTVGRGFKSVEDAARRAREFTADNQYQKHYDRIQGMNW